MPTELLLPEVALPPPALQTLVCLSHGCLPWVLLGGCAEQQRVGANHPSATSPVSFSSFPLAGSRLLCLFLGFRAGPGLCLKGNVEGWE